MGTELAVQEDKQEVLAVREPTTMEIIQQVVGAGGNAKEMAEVIGALVALKQSEVRFQWEREERQSKIDFDDSLRSCQKEIERISPDKEREKGIKWATYKAIDKGIRPIYTKHDFAISFSQENSSNPDRMGVVASLTRSGISREFHREVPIVQPGQTSRADAEEAAYSRAQRYLVLRIFNISVGIDEAEDKPYETKPEDLMDQSVIADFCAQIEESQTIEELRENYQAAMKAGASDPAALRQFDAKKKKVWKDRGFRA